jgi:hypothetical protein
MLADPYSFWSAGNDHRRPVYSSSGSKRTCGAPSDASPSVTPRARPLKTAAFTAGIRARELLDPIATDLFSVGRPPDTLPQYDKDLELYPPGPKQGNSACSSSSASPHPPSLIFTRKTSTKVCDASLPRTLRWRSVTIWNMSFPSGK